MFFFIKIGKRGHIKGRFNQHVKICGNWAGSINGKYKVFATFVDAD